MLVMIELLLAVIGLALIGVAGIRVLFGGVMQTINPNRNDTKASLISFALFGTGIALLVFTAKLISMTA